MQTRYQLRHSPAAHRTLVESRPARLNGVSIQASQACVALDHDGAHHGVLARTRGGNSILAAQIRQAGSGAIT
jgi:hypothetical protein